jgi:hypothetical protein
MRVLHIAIIASVGIVSVPASAQNQVAASENQTSPAVQTSKSAKPAKPRSAAKQGDLICKRLSQGKVCMTAEKWKQYEQIM